MLLLLLCICCNVLLAIIFKAFNRYKVDNLNAIITNYATCTVTASLLIGHRAIPENAWSKPWFPYALILGVMFIIGFNLMALSIQKVGVSLTTIIQKMSLVMPAVFAIVYFDESAGFLKILGITLALSAIVLVNWPDKKTKARINWTDPLLVLPIMVFLLSGLIELGLFYIEAKGLTAGENAEFTATCFFFGGLLGAVYSLYRYLVNGHKWQVRDIIGGTILSIPNYFTIYLLLAMLSKGWDGSVLFPLNSIGILVVSTVVGALFYQERLTRMAQIGLFLALVAIILINVSLS